MERTTISLSEHLLHRLRIIAAERHVSMASIIREAVEEKLDKARPKPKSLGMGKSDYTDTARTLATERTPPRSWR